VGKTVGIEGTMRGKKLSALQVSRIKEPGRYCDGGCRGLYLQVAPGGSKQWLLRYMLNGQARQMGLGSVNTFKLAEARERARRFRQLLADDIDPIEHRKAEKQQAMAERAKQITFADAAAKYIAAHQAGWRNEKHAAQWETTLAAYAYPVIGNLSVAAIDTAHIMRVLDPIWSTKTETASRLRGRLEAVLDWATVRGFRKGNNPAQWRGHLDKLLPKPSKVRRVQHFGAMPYADVPAFMARLRERDDISARALEFTILTAARTGETIGATWDEIDLDAKVWTVPASRIKAGREHRIPLADRAIELLAALPRLEGNPYVFPGAREGKGLSNTAMFEFLNGMDGVNGVTVHGFRSSFRDWAGEETAFPREVIEAALAHKLKDKAEAAYRRGDALAKRRRLMQAWADFCTRPPAKSADVVEIWERRRHG
jgi:integrase